MTQANSKKLKPGVTLASLLLSGLLVSACGGSSSIVSAIVSAGIGGTGIVFGPITGFGSVWVNGRRFEIDDGQIIVDGEAGVQGDLQVGMVVKLEVETENGMFGGSAMKVVFDDEIEGPINGAPVEVGGPGSGVKRFVILEQNITIDATRTLFDGTSYGSIADGEVVEVSGFRTGADEIVATFVRRIIDPPPIEVELRGTIENNNPGINFEINGVLIDYTVGVTEINVDGGQPVDGMFVEVEGLFVTHTSVTAVEIEQEDEDFGDDVDEISLNGIVSQYVAAPAGAGLADFFVNGQRVDASAAELEPADLASLMQDGLEVEVEGEIVGGVLFADELELRADTELRTTVLSVDNGAGSFVVEFPGLGTVNVNTSAQTLFEDKTGAVSNFSLADLMPGDFVEVEGVEIGNTVGAHTVERRNPNGSKLQGAVDAFAPGMSVTILGITYPVDAAATYQENTMSAATFFAALRINDIVELEDDEPDGDADELEIDD